jgi:hypothetical protein
VSENSTKSCHEDPLSLLESARLYVNNCVNLQALLLVVDIGSAWDLGVKSDSMDRND